MTIETYNQIIKDIKSKDFDERIGLTSDLLEEGEEIAVCLCIHDSAYELINRIDRAEPPSLYKRAFVKRLKDYQKEEWFEEELESLWVEIFLVHRFIGDWHWRDEYMEFCQIEYR